MSSKHDVTTTEVIEEWGVRYSTGGEVENFNESRSEAEDWLTRATWDESPTLVRRTKTIRVSISEWRAVS